MSELLPIIVVNWNGSSDTIECIDALLQSTYTHFHIYLVDNGSQQSDIETLKDRYQQNSKVSIIPNSSNLGFAKAHNKVWEDEIGHLSCAYLALINNDTAIDPDALDQGISFAHKHDADSVAFKMIDYQDRSKIDSAGHYLLSSGEIIPYGHKEGVNVYTQSYPTIGSSAGACIYSTRLINETGFFDPYFDTGYEDAEIGLRAFMRGYVQLYCPKAIVYHKGGQSINKVFDQNYAIRTLRNISYTRFKLLPIACLLISTFINFVRSIMIIIGSFIFFKWGLISITLKSAYLFFRFDFRKAMAARREFYKTSINKSSSDIWKEQKSVILYDIKRAYSFLIKREPSAMDTYR